MTRNGEAHEFQRARERITDTYVALDTEWRYTYVNARAGRLLGRDPQELVGRHIWTEFPHGPQQEFLEAYEKALVEQNPVTVEEYFPPGDRWFENRIHASSDGLTIHSLDISERKRAAQMATGQHAILAGIAAQQPLADSLAQIAKLHETLNPGALCSLLLFDGGRRRVLHGAAPSLADAYNEAIHGQEVGDARGSCGTAIWRRERVVVADIATHPFWVDFKDVALENGLLACWSTPVLGSRDQVLGSFAVYYGSIREPGADELTNVDNMLSITAIAIESDELISRLRERDYFFDMSLEIYCIFDTVSQRIVQANPTFSAVTGYSVEELGACHYLDFVHPDDRSIATSAIAVLTGAGMRISEVVYRFRCKDGGFRWLAWESIVGPNHMAFAVAHDVTEHREAKAALVHADTHDGITNLPHRHIFEDALASLLEATGRVWVLLVGLDRFHSINESMGHAVGDDALKQVASRMRGVLGATGLIGRFAGDEFVVAVPGLGDAGAQALAERLRAAVAEPIDKTGYRLALTASIGISHSPEHGVVPLDLLRRADAAMTRAKRHGRDQVCEFSAQQMRDIEERLLLGNRLRGALARGEFELHYQPQRSAGGGALTGFEALLRWGDGGRGAVSPESFIPVAEALGLMPEIGQWLVDEACRQGRAWLDRGHRDFTIAVNISAQELQRPGLAAHVGDALRRHALPAEVLSIELTESSLMENVGRVRAILLELQALGIKLALDDFGTGYSSLAYLKHFPIDKLKIDQRFVRGLPDDGDDAAIARTIVAMAHQLRMLVSAEGVETSEQAMFLHGIGCDELQGYYLGRPVPPDEAEAFFAGPRKTT